MKFLISLLFLLIGSNSSAIEAALDKGDRAWKDFSISLGLERLKELSTLSSKSTKSELNKVIRELNALEKAVPTDISELLVLADFDEGTIQDYSSEAHSVLESSMGFEKAHYLQGMIATSISALETAIRDADRHGGYIPAVDEYGDSTRSLSVQELKDLKTKYSSLRTQFLRATYDSIVKGLTVGYRARLEYYDVKLTR